MNYSHLFLVTFSIMFFANTYANEVTDAQSQVAVVIKDDSSLGNRQNKKYQVMAGVGNEFSMAAFTLSGGYFINPSEVITFRYSRITQNDETEALSNELDKLRAYTLGYKKFFGNSFNIQPTLYYRKSSTDLVMEGFVKSTGTPNLIYDDVGIGFRIGNEWQWDNFVMGADWFGVNKTIKKNNFQTRWQGSPQT